ncbi:CHAT domain-containing protein [Actinoallomurus sp. CA-142502]|uniref:CHAT domain-containing protein n=1 Tax=Actinoallomurus sp. CA-142502 TaxID=3239885 RepID=UPI003D94791E
MATPGGRLGMAARFIRLSACGVAVTPLVIAVVAQLREPSPTRLALLLLAVCVLVSATVRYRITAVVTRRTRTRILLLEVLGGLLALLFAVPVAGPLADLWDGHPALVGDAWWLAPALILLPPVIASSVLRRIPVLNLVPLLSMVFLDKGIFFLAAAEYSGGHGLVWFACWLVPSEMALMLYLTFVNRGPEWEYRRQDAVGFIGASDDERDHIVEAWLADSVVRRVARHRAPNLAFIGTLCSQAESAVMGGQTGTPDLVIGPDDWLDHAVGLVARARLLISDAGDEPTRRAVDLALALCANTRSGAFQYANRLDEGFAARQEALRIWREYGLNDLWAMKASDYAAAARQQKESIVAASPEEILAGLLPLLDRRLSPAMRQWVLLAAAVCHSSLNEHDVANELYARYRQIRPSVLNLLWRLNRDRRVAGFAPMNRVTYRVVDASKTAIAMSAIGLWPMEEIDDEAAGLGPMITTLGWKHEESQALVEEGKRLWFLGRFRAAAEALEQASAVLERDRQLTHAYTVSLQLGMAQRAVDPVGAVRNLGRALSLREEARVLALDADLRMRIGGATEPLYERLLSLLASAERRPDPAWPDLPAAVAFELAERARSRAMLELLAGNLPELDAAPYHDLVGRERRLLAEARRSSVGAVSEEALAEVREARSRLEDLWREMAEVGADGAEYAQLRRADAITYEEVRGMLPADVLLAEYFVGEDSTLLFLARADLLQPRLEEIPLGRSQIRTLIEDVFGHAQPARTLRSREPADWVEPLSQLIEPIRRMSEPRDLVWIVPHDLLHLVPMHALHVDEGPLADRNAVCYAPSAAVMRHCRAKARPGSRRVLLYADTRADLPLVHAREQATSIAGLFAADTVLRSGADATIDALEGDLGSGGPARVLHFACHGRFDPEHPLRSAILMAPGADGDGVLTAERIMAMPLPAGLITLSACESGVSGRRLGDELIGLARSLIYAGAASVLVSLWAVDDLSTSLLMRGFYSGLVEGRSRAEALSLAQRRLRATSLADVIDYCSEAVATAHDTMPSSVRLLLERNIADARYRAGDYVAACADYERLADAVPPGLSEHRRLTAAVARSRAASRYREAASPDYLLTPYAHPYYWAPFVLIGDWR